MSTITLGHAGRKPIVLDLPTLLRTRLLVTSSVTSPRQGLGDDSGLEHDCLAGTGWAKEAGDGT